jgi:DNA processing protein
MNELPTVVSQELLDTLAISLAEGIGPVTTKQLISYLGSPTAVLQASPAKLLKVPGIGDKTIALLNAEDYRKKALSVLDACRKKGIGMCSYLDPQYPARLKAHMDAPLILYTRGTLPLNHPRTIGIVGTRNASAYGRESTIQLVEALQSTGVLVVSGLAYGIDITAHRAALQVGAPTIAVLAGGLDRVYPSEHKATAVSMLESGGWISEYPPGTLHKAGQFPARNRIIALLSDAVIVVEAAIKGGALITARFANNYNKQVFAIPGEWGKTYSEGCLHLIKNHEAAICISAQQVIEEMGWQDSNTSKKKRTSSISLDSLLPEEQVVFTLLNEHKELHIDNLCMLSQLDLSKLASVLLNMEFNRLVKSHPGKKYSLL